MIVQQRFRSLTREMQADIIAWADRELSGNQIHALLKKKYKERAPASRQTVYNFLKWLALQERPDLDDWEMPWSLGAMADPKCDITWADAALVLRVWQRIREDDTDLPDFPSGTYGTVVLTVAEARWVARLGRLAPGADHLDLYIAAVKYANGERFCRIRGEPCGTAIYDETIDLDSPEPFAKIVEVAWGGTFVDRDDAVGQNGNGGES